MNIQMNIFDKRRKDLSFGKLNILYGHSNSGKTYFLNQIIDGVNQKSKTAFYIDGSSNNKNSYDVLYIDNNLNIIEQLKLTTKSILRKMLLTKVSEYNSNDETFLINTNQYLENVNQFIKPLIMQINEKTINGNLNIEFKIEAVEDILIPLMTYYFDEEGKSNCSSSVSKELLFSLIIDYIKMDSRNKIILIDNFDSELDEEITMSFINKIKGILNENVHFILTTNKPTSISYIVDVGKIFCIRNSDIYDLTKINKFIKHCLTYSKENTNHTFEEFLINAELFINENYFNELYRNLLKQIQYNIGRILTTKNYTIHDQYIINSRENVVIYASNEIELKIFNSIHGYINENEHSTQLP